MNTTKTLFTIALLAILVCLYSCEKEISRSAFSKGEDIALKLRDGESNDAFIDPVSDWVCTPEGKDYFTRYFSQYGIPDEILMLEVLCDQLNTSFVNLYNQSNGTNFTLSGLYDHVRSIDELLAIKFDRPFREFYPTMNDYCYVVSNEDRSVRYLNGSPLDIVQLLDGTGGDEVLDVRIMSAQDRVIFNNSENSFSNNMPIQLCDNEDLFEAIVNAGTALCDGRFVLNYSSEVARLRNIFCGYSISGVEICNNGIDDDGDGLVDGADPDCPAFENCTNGIDDDGDGLIDEEDPDCHENNNSPCARDHDLEDNYLFELQLNNPQVLTALGVNTCGPSVSLLPTPYASHVFGQLFPGFSNVPELEEWYDFLIKIHTGSPAGGSGNFHDFVFRFQIYQLANEPEFELKVVTGGGGGAAILTVITPGLQHTKAVSLERIPLFMFSDICAINNWDPTYYGSQMGFSIHEFDNCRLMASSGNTTSSGQTTTKTYTSGFNLNFGIPEVLAGGILQNSNGSYTSSLTSTINANYSTSFADDYYVGKAIYSYCWSTHGVHEISYGNLLDLRIGSEPCE